LRVLEISQTEQAKVLQSLVMNMRNGGRPRNMVSDEEIMKHVQMKMQMNEGGAGVNTGDPSNRNRHPNELIDVSDDDEDDDDDDDDESESSSDSEDDDSDSDDNNDENHDNTTKKIIFNNSGVLDTHAHTIEHLTGDDIKIIELTEPLYHVGGGSVSGSKVSNRDTNDVSDDDHDDDDDEDMSDDDEDMSDDDNNNDNEETGDNTEVKTEELPNHASLPLHQEQEQHLETSVTDTTEIKTIFKADKQQHTDYNSMNVQTLKQHLKTKLSADGMQYNETAINKLNKKELIKHLTQG
jgi:hypothetical protein